MADLLICSRDDVIAFCFGGDAAEAKKLAGVTTWDASILDRPIMAASSEIEGAAGNKFALPAGAPVDSYPYHLRMLAALRAGYYFWLFSAGGKACPDRLQAAKTDTDATLALLREGKQGTGTTKPATSRLSGVVVADLTDGGRFPRMSIEGWLRI